MTYLGQNIKKLGFGLMRLPMIGDDVDIEQTKQMVDLFLSKGFTYFDTAYGYLNGKSEKAIKAALAEGGTQLLEPVMAVTVHSPSASV